MPLGWQQLGLLEKLSVPTTIDIGSTSNPSPSVQLSPHFHLHDFILIYEVSPTIKQIANLTRLCLTVLEPLLVHAGSLRIVNGLNKHADGDAADIVKAKSGRFNGAPNDLWDAFHACGRLEGAHHAVMHLSDSGRPVDMFVKCVPLSTKTAPPIDRGLWLRRGDNPKLERFAKQR